MGYILRVRKARWALFHRVDRGKAGVKARAVRADSDEYRRLGFGPHMTVEAAREALGRVHMNSQLDRELQRGARAAQRVRVNSLKASLWLPEAMVLEFQDHVLASATSRPNKWPPVRALAADAPYPPDQWCIMRAWFYQTFEARRYSPYTCRLYLLMLNAWGQFWCMKTGKTWHPIPPLKGEPMVKVKLAYRGKYKPKEALNPADIERAQAVLPEEEANWLAASLWLGLRPEEVDQLLEPQGRGSWFIQSDDERFKYVLHLIQRKLERRAIDLALCWKAVPFVFPEQEGLLKAILSKKLRRPGPKHLNKVREGLTLRSGRFGFGALLNQLGYSKTCYDRWLGHVGKDTEALHYSQREVAYWEPPQVRKASSG